MGKILDLVEVMSGTPKAIALGLSPRKFDRLTSTIVSRLKEKEFTSTDAKVSFEAAFGEKIPLSTVSTYLSRLAERGLLERLGQGPIVRYRVRPEQLLQSPPVRA